MEWISTQQAAEKLGVNDSRIRQMVRAGQLPAQQIGRAYLINESDLALVADRKPGRPPKPKDEGESATGAAEVVTATTEAKPKRARKATAAKPKKAKTKKGKA
ncbi:MAG: helix-turn-helix domain-containing protein [Acidobacteria bacterium]|nr:helix-turn-helix domain-containing protein [Acidobacteriota bacterium]